MSINVINKDGDIGVDPKKKIIQNRKTGQKIRPKPKNLTYS